MAEYNFEQRKNDILKKDDKSYAGKWDGKIENLCKRINRKNNYYTTSSCSGRILMMIDKPVKDKELFLWTNHEKTVPEDLKKEVERFSDEGSVKFKLDPPIVHVVCKTLKDAKRFLELGFKTGWKNSGIISVGKNIVVEIRGTEKLEFPIINHGKILVSSEFLNLISEKCNQKIVKGWELIKKFENSVNLL